MKYRKTIKLKDGRECVLRNGVESDGKAARELFLLTHGQTDCLLTYSDEFTMTAEQEGRHLQEKTDSETDIEIIAEVDGALVGMAGIEAVGSKYKVRHRADFGISVDRRFWNLGIGGALTAACVECAEKAGFEQLELSAVAENDRALAMYKKAGFVEYGRNPRGMKSRFTGYQEVVYMRLELPGKP